MVSNGGRLRPSPAMLVAFIALFVALAGTAFSVGSRVPGKNGVKSSDVAPKAVKTSDLGAAAVTADKLAANAVTDPKLAANAVTGEKVAPDALTGADINYGSHLVAGTNAEGTNFADAVCPAGEIATGGGARSGAASDTLAVLQSHPQPDPGPATGWRVVFQGGTNAGKIIAYAICMPA